MSCSNTKLQLREIKSLQEICIEIVMRQPLESRLIAFSALKESTLSDRCLTDLSACFGSLQERYDKETLIEMMGGHNYMRAYKQWENSRLNVRRFKSYVGQVLDTPSVTTTDTEEGNDSPYYSYERLKSGVLWPSDVDPSCRETYLSDADFVSIIGMSKDAFNSLKPYMKTRIKKEKLLF